MGIAAKTSFPKVKARTTAMAPVRSTATPVNMITVIPVRTAATTKVYPGHVSKAMPSPTAHTSLIPNALRIEVMADRGVERQWASSGEGRSYQLLVTHNQRGSKSEESAPRVDTGDPTQWPRAPLARSFGM